MTFANDTAAPSEGRWCKNFVFGGFRPLASHSTEKAAPHNNFPTSHRLNCLESGRVGSSPRPKVPRNHPSLFFPLACPINASSPPPREESSREGRGSFVRSFFVGDSSFYLILFVPSGSLSGQRGETKPFSACIRPCKPLTREGRREKQGSANKISIRGLKETEEEEVGLKYGAENIPVRRGFFFFFDEVHISAEKGGGI